MTRVSLVDLEAQVTPPPSAFPPSTDLPPSCPPLQDQARPRADHCIILMEETGRVRGRSQESELRESPR